MSNYWNTRWAIDAACHTDVGRVRQRNEDAARLSDSPQLYAVADGMGGHRAGDRASRIAVDTLHQFFAEVSSENNEAAEAMLSEAFRSANQHIIEDARGRPERLGMGTTLTALLLADEEFLIGHVGDSRAFRIRNGDIVQLTEDHSIVAAQVREGGMTPEEAKCHPMRHVLSRCMGCEPSPVVDVLRGPVESGDVFVLASDGLTGAIGADVIAQTVVEADGAQAASQALVEIARDRDGSDNITAVVVAVQAD